MKAMPTDPARLAALDLVEAVLAGRRPLDMALEESPRFAALKGRERAFARNIASTTIRRLGQIDALIGKCLDRPLKGKAGRVRNLLRVGVCQLMFLDVAPHAAVDTTVGMAHELGLGPYKKLANALLRRLSRQGKKLVSDHDAARLNTPGWLWDSWARAYGPDTCRRIAEAHLSEPALDITVKEDPQTWAGLLKASRLPTGGLRLERPGRVSALAGYGEGAWWIQDAAAALPVRLLGNVEGKKVIDLCAAPGGKTAQLAAAGAQVVAVERSGKRLERLKANLDRLKLSAQVVAADAQVWRPDEPADAVLLDAPCTSTGAIRRHPDVAWLKTPSDVERLSALQARLLKAAARMVKPGGLVVYACCSLQPEEGGDRVRALLETEAGMVRDPISPEELFGIDEIVDSHGDLRCLPCHMSDDGGMDGFFAARLRRIK
ncbi:MAG: transcription antitermination factor NusB [Rhodospirillales bacterium]